MTGFLAGRVAWVTGGVTGMGRAIAVALARAGADVAIGSLTAAVHGERVGRETALDVGEGAFIATARTMESEGVRCLALPLNVRLDASVQSSYEQIVAGLGPIDVLVNAAGHGGRHAMVGHPDDF
ncbi:MAG: SDR family NAD(P)-dependent oxidoreductase [Alphaproteobacteria bacterium]|nr:SDR family NAD(P)-dependent oxidoreductase [Alphaproteobacteria bacterium]